MSNEELCVVGNTTILHSCVSMLNRNLSSCFKLSFASCRGRRPRRPVKSPNPFEALSTSCFFRCLPAAVLSVAAQKVPKEAAQRGVERLAPARRATPPRPPQARYVVFASLRLPGYRCACNLRVAYISITWKRKGFYNAERCSYVSPSGHG